ncbi:hypothetical protein [Chitinophaga alhagiae]|uniref:hypothetical protein n=1 Tax=Chitinophaga alhagiae TaxID=2203219 RepID=UPI000E5A7C4F|nr:hypothetical protein [Chitinophaga alhagiae]
MPSFTDTELQKKFCEGFAFFPFKSLEQHDTLIYKCYTGKDNLKKLLEWHTREHDCSHYIVKITKKLKHTDLPAATELLKILQEAGNWRTAQTATAKQVYGCIVKLYNLLAAYHKKALQPFAAKLADKCGSANLEGHAQMQETMRQFMRNADTLNGALKEQMDKKKRFSPGTLSDEGREYLSKITATMESFRLLQERNVQLLEGWKNRQKIQDYYRAMN